LGGSFQGLVKEVPPAEETVAMMMAGSSGDCVVLEEAQEKQQQQVLATNNTAQVQSGVRASARVALKAARSSRENLLSAVDGNDNNPNPPSASGGGSGRNKNHNNKNNNNKQQRSDPGSFSADEEDDDADDGDDLEEDMDEDDDDDDHHLQEDLDEEPFSDPDMEDRRMRSAKTTQSTAKSQSKQLLDNSKKMRVLLAEDEPTTRMIVTKLLEACEYEVVSVENGRDALAMLRTSRFDLVLSDVLMPEVSGVDLLQELKNQPSTAVGGDHNHDDDNKNNKKQPAHSSTWRQVPVIVMSSQESKDTVMQCFKLGAADFLVKPVRKNELKNLWQHVWRQTRHSEQHREREDDGADGSRDVVHAAGDKNDHRNKGAAAAVAGAAAPPASTSGEDGSNTAAATVMTAPVDELVPAHNKKKIMRTSSKGGKPSKGALDGSRTPSAGNSTDSTAELLLSMSADRKRKRGKAPAAEEPEQGEEQPAHDDDPMDAEAVHFALPLALRQIIEGTINSNKGFAQGLSRSRTQSAFSVFNAFVPPTLPMLNASHAGNDAGAMNGAVSAFNAPFAAALSSFGQHDADGAVVGVVPHAWTKERETRRRAAVTKYLEKRKNRTYTKTVRYESRKRLAETRPRIRGQFVKASDLAALKEAEKMGWKFEDGKWRKVDTPPDGEQVAS